MTCGVSVNPRLCLKPAELRHRVEVQACSKTGDGAGGFTETWATEATVWAAIRPMTAREAFISGQTETPSLHKVKMRYLPGLTTAKRILFGARVFNILEALNIDERNIVHELICEEG